MARRSKSISYGESFLGRARQAGVAPVRDSGNGRLRGADSKKRDPREGTARSRLKQWCGVGSGRLGAGVFLAGFSLIRLLRLHGFGFHSFGCLGFRGLIGLIGFRGLIMAMADLMRSVICFAA